MKLKQTDDGKFLTNLFVGTPYQYMEDLSLSSSLEDVYFQKKGCKNCSNNFSYYDTKASTSAKKDADSKKHKTTYFGTFDVEKWHDRVCLTQKESECAEKFKFSVITETNVFTGDKGGFFGIAPYGDHPILS